MWCDDCEDVKPVYTDGKQLISTSPVFIYCKRPRYQIKSTEIKDHINPVKSSNNIFWHFKGEINLRTHF